MEFIRIVSQDDLPPNTMMMIMLAGKEVLLANVDGSYYAIANKCTHLGGSLSKGNLSGATIKCPRHGAQFDLRTGKAVGPAKIGFLKINVRDEECYPVKVEGNEIWVGMSEQLVAVS